MRDLLNLEPVRLYSIAVAALALGVHFFPALPAALILGLVAAILGVGERVRANVTPTPKVVVSLDDLA